MACLRLVTPGDAVDRRSGVAPAHHHDRAAAAAAGDACAIQAGRVTGGADECHETVGARRPEAARTVTRV